MLPLLSNCAWAGLVLAVLVIAYKLTLKAKDKKREAQDQIAVSKNKTRKKDDEKQEEFSTHPMHLFFDFTSVLVYHRLHRNRPS